MSLNPVSHQWFVQWSPPVAIQNSQIHPSDGLNSDTENWAREATPAQYSWETFHIENPPDRTLDDSGRNDYDARSPFRRPGRPEFRGFNFQTPNQAKQPLERKPYDGRKGSSVYRLLPTMALLFAGAPAQEPAGAPPFRTMFQWRSIDFQFPTDVARQQAINENQFIPENVIPLGIEAWRNKVFLTFPRWLGGVPASLGYVSKEDDSDSPLIRAYPDWDSHATGDGQCDGFTSVFRVATDDCNRLWILDSGQIDALTDPKQACPPQLAVVDLETDKLIARYPLPEEFVLQNSLYSNIVADSRDSQCTNLHIYMTDVWRFGILVFRESDSKFWRFNSHLFFPDPLASDFTLHGVNFQWSDGVFGLSLGRLDAMGDRILYFHPMASYREFRTQVSFLRNEKNVGKNPHALRVFGESRGKDGNVATSAIDRDGVMFSSLVSRDSIGCWDTRKPYTRQTAVTLARNNETLVFPNDLKIDREPRQTIWVITNRLPIFLYSKLDFNDYNYRVIYADAKDAVKGTICDPDVQVTGKTDTENEWVDNCH